MAEIILDHITKRYPDGSLAVDDFNLDIADGEFVILVGPSGCGKSTTLNMIAGLEDITSGELRIGGQVVNTQVAQGPGHRDGVPELRAVPAHDRAGEHGLRAEAGQDAAGHHQREGRGGGPDPGPDPAPGPQAGQPVRRAAAAGGHGPGHRARPVGVPDGRAAVEPGREAAGADAHRGVADPAAPGHHHRVRHARPDRGHDARRPGRGHAPRPAAAGGLAEGALRPAGQPVRGRLHRLAGDELPGRHPRGGQAAHQPGGLPAQRPAAARGGGAPGPGAT